MIFAWKGQEIRSVSQIIGRGGGINTYSDNYFSPFFGNFYPKYLFFRSNNYVLPNLANNSLKSVSTPRQNKKFKMGEMYNSE